MLRYAALLCLLTVLSGCGIVTTTMGAVSTVGSAAPTPVRAPAAEEFIAGELDWDGRAPVPEEPVCPPASPATAGRTLPRPPGRSAPRTPP